MSSNVIKIIIIYMDESLLTKQEVAQMLRVSTMHVYRLTKQGELPVIRRGRRYTRYKKSDVEAFLNRYTFHDRAKNESIDMRTGKHRGTNQPGRGVQGK